MKSGLRLPVDKIRKRLAKLRQSCEAREFKQELDDYTTKTLKDSMNATPVRRPSIITAAQKVQYQHRINAIPSFHEVTDPCLRIKEDGTQFLFFGGKWYRPDIHKLPSAAWGAYQELFAERQRRIGLSESDFIAYRAQARFLYRKSWWQIGLSLNLPVLASANVQDSVTRTRNPVELPPKGYGQARGGNQVISYAIYNPFLELPSKYITFDAQEILRNAAQKNKPAFVRAVQNSVRRKIAAAKRAA